MFPKAKLPALASYALAAAIGLLLAVSIFPPGLILGTDPNAPPLNGDSAAHYTAMRYFIWTRWSWPPFNIPTLGEPPGTNLALADGIPIISLPLKMLRHWLPFRFDPLYPWLTLCCVLQPAAALSPFEAAAKDASSPALPPPSCPSVCRYGSAATSTPP